MPKAGFSQAKKSTRAPARETSIRRADAITDAAGRACLIAKDAAANLGEFILDSSRVAYATIKHCEAELDQLEREIDEKLPEAITHVDEDRARELLTSMKFITDLERIGDLVWWVARRIDSPVVHLSDGDRAQLEQMTRVLQTMLDKAHEGLMDRDSNPAYAVLRLDKDLDEIRHKIFSDHMKKRFGRRPKDEGVEYLFVTQAIERAGDHATNLAEEVIHLVERRSILHQPKRITEG